MPTLTGFDPAETQIIQNAMRDARICLQAALNEAFFDNDGFAVRMAKYFSTSGSDTHAVMKAINSMKLVIDTGVYQVKRSGIGHDADERARIDHVAATSIQFGGSAARQVRTARLQGTAIYEGNRVNVIEAITDYTSKNGAVDMQLFDAYFTVLPYKSVDAQSQVQVFLHELSHVSAGTIDVDAPACYEWSGVQYCKSINRAAANAENYGMFLQSYIS